MEFRIENGPTFATLEVSLQANELVYAEPRSLLSMTTKIEITATVGGSQARNRWLGGFKNWLSGESFFTSTFRAKEDQQLVVLAPEGIGDLLSLELTGAEGFYLTAGAYLASTEGVDRAVKYSGMKGWLAKKGLFLMHLTGSGRVFCSTHGALVRRELAAGERFVVDNRYVIAFADTVTYQLVKATESLRHSVFSGEGLVTRYTGPGVIYYQTRGRIGGSSLFTGLLNAAT